MIQFISVLDSVVIPALDSVVSLLTVTNLDGQKRHEVRNGQHTLSSSAQGTYGAEPNPRGRAVAKRKNSRLGVFSYGAVLSGGVPLCQSVTSKAGIVDDSLNGLCGSK